MAALLPLLLAGDAAGQDAATLERRVYALFEPRGTAQVGTHVITLRRSPERVQADEEVDVAVHFGEVLGTVRGSRRVTTVWQVDGSTLESVSARYSG